MVPPDVIVLWENYRNGELYVSRSIWNGRISDPKTRKSRAPVPVIRQLAERLEMHRLRSGNPLTGPISANDAPWRSISVARVCRNWCAPFLRELIAIPKADGRRLCPQEHTAVGRARASVLQVSRDRLSDIGGYGKLSVAVTFASQGEPPAFPIEVLQREGRTPQSP